MSNVRQLESLVSQAEQMLKNAKENRDRARGTVNWNGGAKTYVSALGRSLNHYEYRVYDAQQQLKKRKAELAEAKKQEREKEKKRKAELAEVKKQEREKDGKSKSKLAEDKKKERTSISSHSSSSHSLKTKMSNKERKEENEYTKTSNNPIAETRNMNNRITEANYMNVQFSSTDIEHNIELLVHLMTIVEALFDKNIVEYKAAKSKFESGLLMCKMIDPTNSKLVTLEGKPKEWEEKNRKKNILILKILGGLFLFGVILMLIGFLLA